MSMYTYFEKECNHARVKIKVSRALAMWASKTHGGMATATYTLASSLGRGFFILTLGCPDIQKFLNSLRRAYLDAPNYLKPQVQAVINRVHKALN